MRKKVTTEREDFASYRYGAKVRNIWFDLSFPEFIAIRIQECFYCGGVAMVERRSLNSETKKLEIVLRNGIDRLDNDSGYIKENCVPCCKWCNLMKSNMSLEEFFKRITQIYNLHIREATI